MKWRLHWELSNFYRNIELSLFGYAAIFQWRSRETADSSRRHLFRRQPAAI